MKFDRIRDLREDNDLTQDYLGKVLNVSDVYKRQGFAKGSSYERVFLFTLHLLFGIFISLYVFIEKLLCQRFFIFL